MKNVSRCLGAAMVACAVVLNTHGESTAEAIPPVSYEEMSPRDCAVPAGEPHEWDCRNVIPSIDRPWTPSGAFLIEAEFTPRSTSMYGTRTVWDNLSSAHTGFRLAFTVNKGRWTPRFWAGFSNVTECVLGPSVQIDPGKPMKFALYFGANGRVVWDFAGARRDATIAVAGSIAPQMHSNPVIGACASAPSNPFDGTIERVSITPCKVDMLNLSLAGRAVFVRGEKDAAVTVRIANMSSSAFVGAQVTIEQFVESGRVRNETSKLGDIARGASADVRFAVETRVRPGWNALRVTVANGTESRTRVFRIGVGPREGDQMKALMWGYGTSESVLADFGFTHGLIYLPPGDIAAGERYDSAVMAGVRLVHDVKVVYPDGEPNEKYMRKRRDGSFPLRGYAKKEIKAPEVSNPVFMETMRKEIEKDVELYGGHPGLVGALAISEARDLSSPSFNTEHLRYRQDTGREVPPEVEGYTLDSRAGLAMAKKRFPDGIVPDDDPVLEYYRWFWRGGDGWPGYSGGIAEEYHRQISRKDFFVFWDPAVRCPPGWGSGGAVDMLNQWVYAVPEPMNVAGPAEEILAMVAGRTGQIPAIMTQLIYYRSQMAPVGKKVSPEPEWVRRRPDAKFPSIPPDVLQEATWSMLAKPVQAVMYHGWATIDESAKSGHGYACTNPETVVRIRHLLRNVVAPLGPTLKRLGRDAPPVAVLESFTTCVFGGPASWGWKAPSITFMQRARLDPRVVYEDTMLRDGLEGVKVLYAPQCVFLPSSVVAKIKEFQRKGGVLVADKRLMKALKADVVVPVVSFDRPPASDHAEDVDAMEAAREGDAKTRLATMRAKSRMVAQANDLRKKLSARYAPEADSSSPEIAVYSRRWKNARYVVAVNDRRTFGDYVGPWGLTMEKGLPFSGDVSLDDADGAVKVVYELSRGGETRFERRGGRIVVPVEYSTNDGRLFAFLPERIASVKVDAPDEVRAGETVRVTFSVLSAAGRPVDALLPAEIRLIDAAGRELDGAGWGCLQGGVCTMDILTNLDDAAGDYRLVCRDRASGLSTERSIRRR
ncbi:MAG: hypothetical protein IJI35_15975 [Kiritimatiellae bacterium]|nr:hypothetical protein [Kiritimatiellia bacterium]